MHRVFVHLCYPESEIIFLKSRKVNLEALISVPFWWNFLLPPPKGHAFFC
jgi:hypothetical protein